ncbi:hypothetical protein BESB_003200 [Besnoitia besnoiti]|uniref:Transmembrane protein n=1 Tax=Besnoitia besnoiti TaxID=94643 RepID=A0A2A9MJ90_BESBE|nr:hypothetical protein BESB_003200 [Besnoitia besnoiti]PFH37979.1 hypothetical protein BESB_003200 [Besnoitia besnoiti]
MEMTMPLRGASRGPAQPASSAAPGAPARTQNAGAQCVASAAGRQSRTSHQAHHARHRPLPIPVARSASEAVAACSSHCPRVLVSAAQQILLVVHAVALLLLGREVYVQSGNAGGSARPFSSGILRLPPVSLTPNLLSPFDSGGAVALAGDQLVAKTEQNSEHKNVSPGEAYIAALSIICGFVFLAECISCLILLFSPVTALPYMRLCMVHRNNRVLPAHEGWYTPSLLTEIVPEIVMAILGAFVLCGFVLSEQQMFKHLAECILLLFPSAPGTPLSTTGLGSFSLLPHTSGLQVSPVAPFVSLLAAASIGGLSYGVFLPYFSSTMIAIVSFCTLCFALSVPFFPFVSTSIAFASPPPSLIYFLPPTFLPCLTLGAFLVVCTCIKHFRKYGTIMRAEERLLSSLRIVVTLAIFVCSGTAVLSFFSSWSLSPLSAGSSVFGAWHDFLTRLHPYLPRVSTCCGAVCALLLMLSVIHVFLEYYSIRNTAVGIRLQGAFFSLFNLPVVVRVDADGNPEFSGLPGLSQCMPSPGDDEAERRAGGVSAPLLLLPGSPMPEQLRPAYSPAILHRSKSPSDGRDPPGILRGFISGLGRGARAEDETRRSLMVVRSNAGVAPAGSVSPV